MNFLALLVIFISLVNFLWLETLLTQVDIMLGLIHSEDFHVLTLSDFKQLVDRSDTLVSCLSQLDEAFNVSIFEELYICTKLHHLRGDDPCDISGLGHWIPVESEFTVNWIDFV